MTKRSRRYLVYFLTILAGCLTSLLILGTIAYISNQNLPGGPTQNERLEPLDKARLAEALHLQSALGDQIWPGWQQAIPPYLLWHAESSFLTSFDQPPPGWVIVNGDQFQGEPYYRQPSEEPQNFAILIGDTWVASLATKHETDLFMRQAFQEMLPDWVEPFFPFRLLILNSELHISGLLHESFHVYQARQAPDKFAAAEAIYPLEDAYWQIDPQMQAGWKSEIELLIEAIQTPNQADAVTLARQFLANRQERRQAAGLTPELANFERRQEWLEGLAKYVELASWQAAGQAGDYQPLPAMEADPDFKDYQTYDRRWRQELDQARRQASEQSVVRFYYTGLLQARLLDRLLPDWKARAFETDLALEDMLQQAVDTAQ
ncbi:MAG: hypothetical protein JW862_09395 [Anaerolineales bacterium]|nr:hypothetical protein [Anaerolineales bacterium]